MAASRVRSTSTKTGLITSYGLFWRVEEPGLDKKRRLSLFGWQGRGRDLRLADFSHQRGIYILYGRYGPHYVGLAGKDSLGSRLVRHLSEKAHKDYWDRFSWFGFRRILAEKDGKGRYLLDESVAGADPIEGVSSRRAIRDIEAMMINGFGLHNVRPGLFFDATEWFHVPLANLDEYKRKAGELVT